MPTFKLLYRRRTTFMQHLSTKLAFLHASPWTAVAQIGLDPPTLHFGQMLYLKDTICFSLSTPHPGPKFLPFNHQSTTIQFLKSFISNKGYNNVYCKHYKKISQLVN